MHERSKNQRAEFATEDWVRVVLDPCLPPVACKRCGVEVEHGDVCVIETSDGAFLGRVSCFTPPVVKAPRRATGNLRRLAREEDIRRAENASYSEAEAEQYLVGRVRDLGLEMRPVKVRFPLAGRKLVVYFVAEKRIDFRALVKELASRFRRRVEMRPLGVRDGAKVLGALGPCGRALCCCTFMDRFHSVTVRMAKRQNLSLNPTKISGMCGRLMCCLAHEVDLYPAPKPKR